MHRLGEAGELPQQGAEALQLPQDDGVHPPAGPLGTSLAAIQLIGQVLAVLGRQQSSGRPGEQIDAAAGSPGRLGDRR